MTKYEPDFAALAQAEAMRKVTEAHLEDLRVATVKITIAVEDRNEAIREAYRDGVPASTIAEAVRLTRQRVHQLTADVIPGSLSRLKAQP